MAGLLFTLAAFLLAVLVVVVVHEMGHFLAARHYGFPVLRFSFGFGKPLVSRTDRNGTEWAFAPIPLGGYVKLLDMEVVRERGLDESQAFENQPIGKRAVVMVAGPLANFLFAFLAYWSLTLVGESGHRPIIGKVHPDTPAAAAGFEVGDVVSGVDGTEVGLWGHFAREILLGVTAASTLTVEVHRGDGLARVTRVLDLGEIEPSVLDRDMMREVGVYPDMSFITREIESVVGDSPAEQGGVEVGDTVLAVDGAAMETWDDVVRAIEARPGQEMGLTVSRDGDTVALRVTPESVELDDGAIGRIGVRPRFDPERLEELNTTVSYGFWGALKQAGNWTVGGLLVTYRFVKFLFQGKVSTQNIAGPVRIAQFASDSLWRGLVSFITFLAAISISLGVINLLPIPVLDGGHLLLYAVEFVRGRKLSDRATGWVYGVGAALLVSFMVFAILNDIARL